MFHIGEMVIYGSNGVCRVENVGPIDSAMDSQREEYYTLSPLNNKESKIFTPVDNPRVIMRPTISKEEAQKLISEIKDVESLWIVDERKRENEYKEALRKCDCRECVRIIKTIYDRKKERIADGKKVTAVDEKYYNIAENNLYGELAISLGMGIEEAKEYVVSEVQKMVE